MLSISYKLYYNRNKLYDDSKATGTAFSLFSFILQCSPHRFKAQVLLIDTCALITHVAAFANGSKIYLVLEHCSLFIKLFCIKSGSSPKCTPADTLLPQEEIA